MFPRFAIKINDILKFKFYHIGDENEKFSTWIFVSFIHTTRMELMCWFKQIDLLAAFIQNSNIRG